MSDDSSFPPKLRKVQDDFRKRLVKSRELEKVVFSSVFDNDPARWPDALRASSFIRRTIAKETSGVDLVSIGSHFTSVSKPGTTGIELQIGGAAIPLGLTDPVLVHGDHVKGALPLPLATNEAALVAGMNRGIGIINRAGGVRSIVCFDGMTRAPVIECPSVDFARKLRKQLQTETTLLHRIKAAAEKDATVSRLMDVQTFQQSKFLWLRFVFQTGDAMGMNSATRYAANAVEFLQSEFPEIRPIALSGNMCTDKKSTHVNVLLNRGKHVETEVTIPAEVLAETRPHVTPRVIERLNFVKNWMGSSLSGTIAGFNANAGNAVAALFAATGQDLAQITESSSCFVYAEDQSSSLYFGVSLPSIEVGTTGGGTESPTAQEALRLLKCVGRDANPGENARRLAEVVGAAVTAQELNLLISLASGSDLADSHIRLARGSY